MTAARLGGLLTFSHQRLSRASRWGLLPRRAAPQRTFSSLQGLATPARLGGLLASSLHGALDRASLWSLLPHLVPPSTVAALLPQQHAALDDLVAVLRARNVLAPWTFYSRGFGRVRRGCVDVARELRETSAALAGGSCTLLPRTAQQVELAPSLDGRDFAHVAEGRFPAPAMTDLLPAQSLEVRFQLITPRAWRPGRPVVVMLPGTGEHGFLRRRHLLGYPLAQRGIGSVILEGPFYGARRDPAQFGSKLLALANLIVLGRATIQEAVGLVAWLRARTPEEIDAAVAALPRGSSSSSGSSSGSGSPSPPPPPSAAAWQAAPQHALGSHSPGHAQVLLTGVSMGGLHAAMTASMLPPAWDRAGFVSWLGPPSGAGVFTRGALARACDWRALTAQASADVCEDAPGGLEGALGELGGLLRADVPMSQLPSAEDAARLGAHWPGLERSALQHAMGQACRVLRLTDVAQFPPPARCDASAFYTAAHDRYVPAERSERELWGCVGQAWQGCAVESLSAGHVSGSLLQVHSYLAALEGAVGRL